MPTQSPMLRPQHYLGEVGRQTLGQALLPHFTLCSGSKDCWSSHKEGEALTLSWRCMMWTEPGKQARRLCSCVRDRLGPTCAE